MRKVINKICLIILTFVIFSFITVSALVKIPNSQFNTPDRPPTGSNEELYKDIFVTLLDPCINNAIKDYYGKSYSYDPWDVDILSIKRPNGDRTPFFTIKLQVMPYVEAHNSVGIDNLTIKVEFGEGCKVEKFEHKTP